MSKVTVAHVKMQTEARKKIKKKMAEAAANRGSYFNFGAQEEDDDLKSRGNREKT